MRQTALVPSQAVPDRCQPVSTTPLAGLLDLPGVATDVVDARDRIDAVLRHRALRRRGGELAAEVGLRCAVASAQLEAAAVAGPPAAPTDPAAPGGGDPVTGYAQAGYDLAAVRSGTVTDPLLQGALRVSGALDALAGRWAGAPRQVLARLHTLAAHGLVGPAQLGRPVSAAAADRLGLLADLVTTAGATPPILLAAVVHGELLTLRPFAAASGVVARAAARLTLVSTGVDPRGLVAVDVGHRQRGPEYTGAANAFATGTPDGVRSWLRHYARALRDGAAQTATVADELTAPHGEAPSMHGHPG